MFLGNYHAKILLLEVQGKKVNRKKIFIIDILEKLFIIGFAMLTFIALK